jgi:cobalt/nickel transport system ATP-binding protein
MRSPQVFPDVDASLLAFEQVSYCYPCSPKPALRSLSLTIPVGRRCALLGQNGSGKTTLFRLANGLYRPDRGRVRWRGEPLQYDRPGLSHLRQQVGLVFQNPEQQLVATTVTEDLSYGLCNLGLPEAEIAARVAQALVDFQLQDLADAPVNYLSLGQKKRVAIAGVMILRPQLLLLDEPTAYLDPRGTRELITQLAHIHAGGTTIVMASHNLDFVYQWADWVVVMDAGQVVLAGTPDQVFAQQERLFELQLGIPLAIALNATEAAQHLFAQRTQRLYST